MLWGFSSGGVFAERGLGCCGGLVAVVCWWREV